MPSRVFRSCSIEALSGQQTIQRVVQAVLGHGAVGHAEQVFQTGGDIPVFGQSKLAAGAAETIDHLDGYDIGRPHCFFALGDVTLDDLVEAEEFPEPECQPDVTESASVGPADRTQPDAHHVGIIGNRDLIVIGEEAELLRIALAVVDDHGALPTMLLVVVQFAEIGDDMLPRPGLGAQCSRPGRSRCGTCRLCCECIGVGTCRPPEHQDDRGSA